MAVFSLASRKGTMPLTATLLPGLLDFAESTAIRME
jgi:hypothetical protein